MLRNRIGDWGADIIIGTGCQGATVSLVGCASGFAKLIVVPTREEKVVTQVIIKALSPYREKMLTITFDNGKEFVGDQKIAKRLKAECYFADPYSSW